jgi:hypothetical protein
MHARLHSLPLFSVAALGVALAGAVAPPAFAAESAAAERCAAQGDRKLVGFVVAVTGSGFIENPDCKTDKRPLACGDLLFEHDQISTGPGGHTAFLAKNVYTQMDSDSEIRVGLTDAGGPDLSVLRGHARITDQRKDAADAPHRIRTPYSQILASGADTEVIVKSDPQSASGTLCEWAKPLDVTPGVGGTGIAVQPGECVVAGPQAPLRTGPGTGQKLTLAEVPECDLDVGDQFDPNDVAANGDLALAPPPRLDPGLQPLPPPPPGPPPTPPPGPPPTVLGVRESPPVFRPPPGLGPR